jgi:7,8-didemethyl-8-hydroxy-5-deazariboflavin synthase
MTNFGFFLIDIVKVFHSFLFLGIGETFEDRVRTIEDIASVARRYGNIQEVIIQPYSPGAKDKYSCKYIHSILCIFMTIHMTKLIPNSWSIKYDNVCV